MHPRSWDVSRLRPLGWMAGWRRTIESLRASTFTRWRSLPPTSGSLHSLSVASETSQDREGLTAF
jgi:hypothetical protein